MKLSNAVRAINLESLEGRRLFAVTPGHVSLMQRSVAEVTPTTNLYANGTPTVTWAGLNGATATTVTADCTTYITVLLKQAYKWTNSDFVSMFTVSSPSITRYYNQAVADQALDGFKQISEVKPGDLFISRYDDGTTGASGHMVVIESAPTLVSVGSQYRAYDVAILDVTGSPHTNDTRAAANADGTNDTGVGRGNIRLYTDLDGNLDHWAWGTRTTSSTYTAEERPVTFAHIPALSIKSPSALKATATGEDTVSLSWTDNSGIEDGYYVQRSADNGATWTTVGDTGAGGNTLLDSTPPGTYRYRVYAVAGASQSGYSAAATVTLTAAVPDAPTAMTATLSGAYVRIAWQDNAATEANYVLERSVDGGTFVPYITLPANSTGYLDTTATGNRLYQYRLTAAGKYASSGTVTASYDSRTITRPGTITRPMTLVVPKKVATNDMTTAGLAPAAPSFLADLLAAPPVSV